MRSEKRFFGSKCFPERALSRGLVRRALADDVAELMWRVFDGMDDGSAAIWTRRDVLIESVVTVYRCDRTPSCGRSRKDLQPTL